MARSRRGWTRSSTATAPAARPRASGAGEEGGPRVIREQLADHAQPENLPKGNRSQEAAALAPMMGKPAPGRRSTPARQAAQSPREAPPALPERVKTAYKAGWARPKIKPRPTPAVGRKRTPKPRG